MTPVEYLTFYRDDILSSLISGSLHSNEEADEIFRLLLYYVKKLASVRNSESKTNSLLAEIDNYEIDKMRSLKHWLLNAVEKDDTYCYVYNKLVQYSNRTDPGLFEYPIKCFTKQELYNLLNNETKESGNLNKTTETEGFLDFSDNTDAEKIVFLHELGILEFLNKKAPFNTSINKLAEVVSAFTGINQTTAQSYLNPMFSKGGTNQKNNPLTTTKRVKTITEKLLKMGYPPK